MDVSSDDPRSIATQIGLSGCGKSKNGGRVVLWIVEAPPASHGGLLG